MRRMPRVLPIVLMCLVPALAVPAATLPDTPEGTVRAVTNAIADGHPEILWEALPASYQQDITEITRLFAEKVDPNLWNSVFSFGRKAATVMQNKRDIILASNTMKQAGKSPEDMAAGWDTATAMLDTICSSDVAKIESLKTISWPQFLSTTGKTIVTKMTVASAGTEEDPIAKMKATEIEVVETAGDTATLRMTTPGEDPEELKLTRVEGRWVPTDMATDWDKNMDEARTKLEGMTAEEQAATTTQAMMFLGMGQGLLDQIANAERPEQFDQMLQGMLGPMLGGMGQGKSGNMDEGMDESMEDEGEAVSE